MMVVTKIALPFGAGALLAAAFFDLLPEAFDNGSPWDILLWVLVGFTVFFLLERLAPWFYYHHEHKSTAHKQNLLIMTGDLLHNIIDGLAIGAAFLTNPVTGFITTIAVSAHKISKELGTFGILLSCGWKDKKVLLANVLTALGTLLAASLVYWFGRSVNLPIGPLLAMTSGFFVYVASSDIMPDIHEQNQRNGSIQALILLCGILFVGLVRLLLGV